MQERATAEREAAVSYREAEHLEIETAVAGREVAASGRGTALLETEAAVAEREIAVSTREAEHLEAEAAVARREAAVSGRETALIETEATVAERERRAEEKESEATEVIDTVRSVADGDLAIPGDDPSSDETEETALGRPALARRLFGKALARLRGEERAAARSEVEDAFAQISCADVAIMEIAKSVPLEFRGKIAAARQPLFLSIRAFGSQIGGKPRRPRHEKENPPKG